MLGALVGLVVGQFRSRASLLAENELLRQQLAAAKSRLQRKRVRFTGSQRLTIALLTRWTASWRATVTLVAAGHCASLAPGGLPPSVAMAVTNSRPNADALRDADPRDDGAKPKLGRRAASRRAAQAWNPGREAHRTAIHEEAGPWRRPAL